MALAIFRRSRGFGLMSREVVMRQITVQPVQFRFLLAGLKIEEIHLGLETLPLLLQKLVLLLLLLKLQDLELAT
jgi:hypothetical protein